MKCRVCGRELDPQKSFCDKCGTPVGKKMDDGEFSWNTIDFPKPKAVHDIDMNWGNSMPRKTNTFVNNNLSEGFVSESAKGKTQLNYSEPKGILTKSEPAPAPSQPKPEPQPQQAAPQPQPAVQPQSAVYSAAPQPMSWTVPQSTWTIPTQQQVVIPQPYNVQPQAIPTAAPVISPMPQMPQGMYGQPLYVTQPIPAVQYVQPSVQYVAPQPAVIQQAPQPQPVPAAPEAAAPQQPSDAFDADHTIDPRVASMPVAPAAIKNPVNVDTWLDNELQSSGGQVRDDRFFTFYKKNEDFQKLLDEEYQKYKDKYDTNAESLKQSQILSAAAINAAAQAMNREPASTEDGSDDVRRVDRFTKDFAAAPTSVSTNTMVFNPEDIKKQAEKFINRPTQSSDFFDGEPVTEFDKMIAEGTTSADQLGDSTLAISNKKLREEIDEVAKKVEAAYGGAIGLEAYDKNQRQQELQNMASARDSFFGDPEENEDEQDKVNAQEIRSIFEQWDKERQEAEERKPRKSHRFGKFILTLILLLAIFAGADYAVIKFMPDGDVKTFFENLNISVFELYAEVTGKELPQKVSEVVEMTLQEKTANSVNKNIEIITFDVDASKFDSQATYGITNLGSKTVVTDEQIIADLTKVIVAYNSSWIDYVNEGSDISCLDYLKTDGNAFRQASNFDRLGKEESFKKLNIGEVRMDSNNYYVFCNEQIKVKTGSATSDSNGNNIYVMTQVGDKYMIVECVGY